MHTPLVRLAALSMTAALLLLHAPPAHAASVTVTAPTAKGAKGAEVSIPITVTAAPGVGALHVELTYDDAVLEGLSVSGGKLASNALVDGNPIPGRLIMGLVSSDKIDGDGEVFVAKFRVLGEKGATSTLGLDKVQAWEATLDRLDIAVTAQPGTFTVAGGSSSFPWWIIAVAVAVLLLLFLVWKRRRRDEEPVSVAAAVTPVAPIRSPSEPPSKPRSGPPSFSPSESPSPPPSGFHFTVDRQQTVVDSGGANVGTLTTGQTYVARRAEGEWTEVDSGNGLLGWIPTDSVHRAG